MKKTVTLLSVALALAICASSCVTFSTSVSPRKDIGKLAVTQLNVVLGGPVTALNWGLSGADSLKYKTPGTTVDVTVNGTTIYDMQIYSQYLKVTCVSSNSWTVVPDKDKKGTIYDNIDFVNLIELQGEDFKCVFLASENDQNGLTATFGSEKGVLVRYSPGQNYSLGQSGWISHSSSGSADFEYFYNQKTLDFCTVVFSNKDLIITTTQDSK